MAMQESSPVYRQQGKDDGGVVKAHFHSRRRESANLVRNTRKSDQKVQTVPVSATQLQYPVNTLTIWLFVVNTRNLRKALI